MKATPQIVFLSKYLFNKQESGIKFSINISIYSWLADKWH